MKHKIAVIAGDGIGQEVMPEGLRVLEVAARKFALDLEFTTFEWANCDYYVKHGKMMPDDWFDQLKGFDAIYFGAAGWPATVPDHISLWGSLIKFRRDFDQYVNLRPVRLMPVQKNGDARNGDVREHQRDDHHLPPSGFHKPVGQPLHQRIHHRRLQLLFLSASYRGHQR